MSKCTRCGEKGLDSGMTLCDHCLRMIGSTMQELEDQGSTPLTPTTLPTRSRPRPRDGRVGSGATSNASYECPKCQRPVSRAGQLCSVCDQWIEDVTAEQVRRGAAVHEEWKRQDRGGASCLVAAIGLMAGSMGLVGLMDVIV